MAGESWLEVARGRILEVTQGDITRVAADAIVNAANEHLQVGGGVDGAIHRAGGPTILAELDRRYGRDRRCQTGKAVWTRAGILPARWVIHAVGPIWQGGDAGERELLASAYRSAFEVAEDLGARSIAFPAISCGVYGYPIGQGAAVALEASAAALRRSQALHRATFVLVSFDTYEVFRAALADVAAGVRGA
jgi:O-acetyl-ADP-ribose deacetylase (regulator of RNase III)